ncbi:protein kinase [uncultured Aquimarina sp.]|uniref:protein kinase domain-containing protein n=1 Tax=uncultured Aquimarina sp. TaxID=575652 RepID=UPI0026074F59|nr:protein kinase [uncultured Aquimarina sp.]
MSWTKKYKTKGKNIGGGQGDCFLVESIETKSSYFLKILKDSNNSSERRARFFRETTLFKSLEVDGIPKIIDTNVNDFKSDNELYYCAEYINGKSLDKYVANNKLDEKQVINISRQLFTILKEIHNQEVVHRDIKPENIIISSNKLYLVDFGISVNLKDLDKLTKTGHELGNRFLRLPEFSAGSNSKRDIRSDLTLASGIILYLITNEYPRNLVNQNGEYPHQKDKSVEFLSNLEHSIAWNIIFDKAFQQDLSKRWSSSDEIIEILDFMEKEKKPNNSKIEEYLELHAREVQSKNLDQLKESLIELNKQIKRSVYSIIHTKAEGFRTEEMGKVYNLGDLENRNQIRAYPIGKMTNSTINVVTRLVGEQIVGHIEINGKNIEICRVKNNDTLSEYEDQQMKEAIISNILPELIKQIEKNL